jgi:hypothetical protein
MPTHREVNQREKFHRLPSADRLRDSQDRITSWWDKGYQLERNQALTERFFTKDQAALPSLESPAMLNLRDLFKGLELQRIRLHHDRQVPEWK